ncbi:ATP-binding protein [Bremerella cremea]
MRAFGYTLETALADLIDNSISAGAKKVWLHFHWSGRNSRITLTDDGNGMDEAELVCAMRPGSRHPLEQRDPKDLGRFGLGLKSASFSQCRRLTVGSRRSGDPIAVRRWDLDYLAEVSSSGSDSGWRLLRSAAPGSEAFLAPLEERENGTMVLWEQLDRIVGDSEVSDTSAQERFYQIANSVVTHLAMVFHRFLEGSRPRLSIYVNGADEEHRITPWDPFMSSHSATLWQPQETITLGSQKVVVQGFVLPHKDKLQEEEHQFAAGPRGWNSQQGFYVYRNERMLVAGSWLGLGKPRPWTKDEHYKLSRISIDIPNSVDGEWQIDVKKSTARPPARVRKRLRQLAELVRDKARQVFAHRGVYSSRRQSTEVEHVWKPGVRDGRTIYRIDRGSAAVRQLMQAGQQVSKELESLLKLLEETVPVQQIWLDVAERPDTHARPFERAEDKIVIEVMTSVYRALRSVERLTHDQACKRLGNMAPFREHMHLLSSIVCEE